MPLQLSSLPRYLKSSALFALHDAVTRGRTHWVEQATDVGAARPVQPFWRCLVLETCCGLVGVQLSLEYMRLSLSSLKDGGESSMIFNLWSSYVIIYRGSAIYGAHI